VADVVTKTGASALIGQTEGTVYAEVDVRSLNIDSRAIIYFTDNSSNNWIRLEYQTIGVNDKLVASVRQSGVTRFEFIQTNGLNEQDGLLKIAFAYSSENCAVYQNGAPLAGSVNVNNDFTSLGVSKINIGSRFDNANFLNDHIKAAAIYTTRLSNTELESLTTL
jgi:hypothetical protein